MPRYLMRVRTPQPAAEVFDYLADVRNFSDWDPGTASVRQVRGDGPGTGAEYDLDTGGTTLHYVVDSYDPPARLRIVGRNRLVTSRDEISVMAEGEGCMVTYDADLTANGFLKVLNPLLAIQFRRLGKAAAAGLVRRLDGVRVA
jgi:hypothetical protein